MYAPPAPVYAPPTPVYAPVYVPPKVDSFKPQATFLPPSPSFKEPSF